MTAIRAAGVFAREQDDKADWLGTAFAFRDGSHYLTASHCVPDGLSSELPPGSGLTVSLPSGVAGMGFVGHVRSFVRHPTADLAVLKVEGKPPGALERAAEPFTSVGFAGSGMAEEFLAFGYPMSREPAPTFPGIGPTCASSLGTISAPSRIARGFTSSRRPSWAFRHRRA